jgi:hypothetical protein
MSPMRSLDKRQKPEAGDPAWWVGGSQSTEAKKDEQGRDFLGFLPSNGRF